MTLILKLAFVLGVYTPPVTLSPGRAAYRAHLARRRQTTD